MKYLIVMFALIMSAMLFVGCGSTQTKILVVMPDGAPTLSMATLMNDRYRIGDKKTKYQIVNASNIGGYVANEQADLAILPLNLATKVCGDNYQILSVMTFGNLYLLGKGGVGIESVVGKNLSVINLNNVPGLTTMMMLEELNIHYSQVEQKADNIKLIGATASELIGGFLSGKVEYAIVAEPAVSLILSKVDGLKVIDNVQTRIGNYPQSVLVVKKGVFKESHIINLVDKLSTNRMFLQNNIDKIYNIINANLEKGVVTAFKSELIDEDLIDRCNVGFDLASDMTQDINDYIGKLREILPNSANNLPQGVIYEFSR